MNGESSERFDHAPGLTRVRLVRTGESYTYQTAVRRSPPLVPVLYLSPKPLRDPYQTKVLRRFE